MTDRIAEIEQRTGKATLDIEAILKLTAMKPSIGAWARAAIKELATELRSTREALTNEREAAWDEDTLQHLETVIVSCRQLKIKDSGLVEALSVANVYVSDALAAIRARAALKGE